MGTALPPNEPRTACSLCFGPNPILGDTQPRWIRLTFHGVGTGTLWEPAAGGVPTGPYLLDHRQDCMYQLTGGNRRYILDWTPTRTRVSVEDEAFGTVWTTPLNNGQCLTRVTPTTVGEYGQVFWGGYCTIDWDLTGLV